MALIVLAFGIFFSCVLPGTRYTLYTMKKEEQQQYTVVQGNQPSQVNCAFKIKIAIEFLHRYSLWSPQLPNFRTRNSWRHVLGHSYFPFFLYSTITNHPRYLRDTPCRLVHVFIAEKNMCLRDTQ